jgi:hypothetical protein
MGPNSLPTRQMLCAAENLMVYRRAHGKPQAEPAAVSRDRHATALANPFCNASAPIASPVSSMPWPSRGT